MISLNKTALSSLSFDAPGRVKSTHQGVATHSLRNMDL